MANILKKKKSNINSNKGSEKKVWEAVDMSVALMVVMVP